MKKIILSVSIVMAFVTGLNAQVQFGPELGLVISNLSGGGNKTKMGAKIGGIADIPFGDHFGLQPGIFYAMMGAKNDILGTTVTTSINYIQIPINLIYKLGEPGGNRLFFAAGPQIGYCLGGKTSGGGSDQTLKVGTGSDANVKPIDFGVDVNVGYQLSSGLLFRAGYYIGMANVNAQSGPTEPDMKNSAIMISAAWLFGGSSY